MFLLFPTSLCGVLVFRLDPAGAPPPLRLRLLLRRRLLLTHSSLTHSLIHPSHSHSLTHYAASSSLTHYSVTLTHSLTHSLLLTSSPSSFTGWLRHSLTHSLIHSPSHSHSLTTSHLSLIIHHSSLHHSSHLTHHSPLFTTPLITSHCSFPTLHSSHAAFRVAGAVQRPSWLPFAWQAQYTEPPEELRRAWAPLARGWLSRGCRVAGAVHRASLSSFGFGTSWYFAGVAAISGFGLRYHDAVCKVWSSVSLCRMLAVSVGSHCRFSTRS